MQVCLHGITRPEVQDDIDLLDLKNCLYLAVTMQVWKPRAPDKTKATQDTPFIIARVDETEIIDREKLMILAPSVGIEMARTE